MIDSGVAAHGGADLLSGDAVTDAGGEVSIGGRLAIGNPSDQIPYATLQRSAADDQLEVERAPSPRQILGHLVLGFLEALVYVRTERQRVRAVPVMREVHTAQSFGLAGRGQFTQRRTDDGVPGSRQGL